MDNTKTINVLSLCTGYGGFELALQSLWPEANIRVVAVEIEAYAAANLVAKAEQGKMAIEAIYSDLKTFPAERFSGCFDLIVAGYPCQPFSNAGQRRGSQDPRHLWPYICDILRQVRPVCAVFENVRGHVKNGLYDVLRDLSDIGYIAECGIFSAVEVGASHKRERLFILAHAQGLRYGGRDVSGNNEEWPFCSDRQERDRIWSETSRLCTVSDTVRSGFQREKLRPSVAYQRTSTSGPVAQFRAVAKPGQEQHEWEQPRTIEPGLGRTVNGFANWVDRVRLIGNGIVPQTAVKAISYLLDKMKERKVV